MPFDMNDPCETDEAICSQVYEWTENQQAANSADLLRGHAARAGRPVRPPAGGPVGAAPPDRPAWSGARRAGSCPTAWGGSRFLDGVRRQRGRADHARDLAATTRRAQRAKTIGDLFKSIVTGVLVAIIGTMMLSEIGVDIAPIIASAGIIGIALGFGAQSLVKDFLSAASS